MAHPTKTKKPVVSGHKKSLAPGSKPTSKETEPGAALKEGARRSAKEILTEKKHLYVPRYKPAMTMADLILGPVFPRTNAEQEYLRFVNF